MDVQTRQTTHHVEYELEWEAGFTLQVKVAPIYSMIVNWCKTDRIVFIKTVRMLFKTLAQDADLNPKSADDPRYDPVSVCVNETTTECVNYAVSNSPVSFHQPLTRLLAALAVHMTSFDLDFDANEFDIPERPTAIKMMEPCLRVTVLIAQVQGGMWRRNGYSVVEQVRRAFLSSKMP